MKFLRALASFNRDLRALARNCPQPHTRLTITEDMLPWLDVVLGCVHQDCTPEQAKKALWQAGLYMNPDDPEGKP